MLWYVTGYPSFLRQNYILLDVRFTFSLAISSANGYVDCFHLLAFVNNIMEPWVYKSWDPGFSSLGYIYRSGINGSYGNFKNVFEEAPYCCPKWLYHSHPQWIKSPFSLHPWQLLSIFFSVRLFGSSHPNGYEMIYCGFDLQMTLLLMCYYHLFYLIGLWTWHNVQPICFQEASGSPI
jgi:hypothetical protein